MLLDPRADRCGDLLLAYVDWWVHGAQVKRKSKLRAIGHELKTNPPSVLGKTRAKFGPVRAEKQRKAILLSKARKSGMRIPKRGKRR